MKKNFAIDLTTCSKKDRKEAIILAKENGWKWRYDKRFKDHGRIKWKYIYFKDKKFNYCHEILLDSSLSLPNDWDKFKEYIGIKEPKKGEVWVASDKTDWIHRIIDIEGEQEYLVYSCLDINNKLSYMINIDVVGCKERPATPEEISKLEKAERENGYWWNGEELLKVEYVKLITENKGTWQESREGEVFEISDKDNPIYGSNWRVKGDGLSCIIGFEQGRPATKEEYESQNTIDYKAKYYELKKELERLSKL